jgi:hypothetical protein
LGSLTSSLSIALTAMSTGPRAGALAGLAGTALYVVGILANSDIPSREVLTEARPFALSRSSASAL